MTFQIFFECRCFFARTKRNHRLNVPGTVLGSVGNLTGIVSFKTSIEVICKPRIVVRSFESLTKM